MMTNPDFDKIVQAYRDRYGIDLSHMYEKKAGYRYENIDDESVARHKKGYRNVGRIRLLKTTRGVFVVKDGKLVGFINTEKKDDGKTWVQALEVTPGFRRKGIARELLRKAVDDMGATNLTVRKTNDAARRLYDSEGWVPYKEEGIMEFRKKAESYSLKDDPTYEDALKVFNKLDFDDRANLVPRHPDFLRDVPADMLFDRQVVVDGNGNPVGFQEFYSRKDKRGRRLPPHNIVAVVPEARGNGLARIMAEAAIRKARKERIKRLVWEAFADNEPSIRAALSTGFRDATPKNAKGYRKFVYDVEKKASSKKETYESGEGEVESYTPEKTEGHDEIVIRLKDGSRVRISNNTRLGKILRAKIGSRVGYHGYRIGGTDVVHRVHPNAHSRGGWLETSGKQGDEE